MAREVALVWGGYEPTRLIELPELASAAGVGRVLLKLENERPLGNFKSLGGMIASLRAMARVTGVKSIERLLGATEHNLPHLVCASDGNHGLAVAAAANRVGARATIFLPRNVSAVRSNRITDMGASIVWVQGTYDDAVDEANAAASRGEGLLIADTTDRMNDPVVNDVMSGYSLIADELKDQLQQQGRIKPSHLFVQAGVGGLAAALTEGLMATMQAPCVVVVVEPAQAACVAAAISAGRPIKAPGDLETSAEMLSCGRASAPALDILMRHKARSIGLSEAALDFAVGQLSVGGGPATTPSGAAGLAGLLEVAASPQLRKAHRVDKDSIVLLLITEGDPRTANSCDASS